MAAESTGAVAVTSGLFRQLTPPTLLGSRCQRCGSYYFPRIAYCRNPACAGASVVEVALSRRGLLYSYTVQHYRPPAPFDMQPWAPYGIGILALPEGLRIAGMLAGLAFDELRIGMELEIISDALRRDEQGRSVLTYKFARPAGAGA
jgi:uncharacterized OB-fold protein